MKNISKYSLILSALVLNACDIQAHQVDPVEVKIPVPVSCNLSQPVPPKWRIPYLLPNASDVDKLKAELADLELSRGYIDELEAALSACG